MDFGFDQQPHRSNLTSSNQHATFNSCLLAISLAEEVVPPILRLLHSFERSYWPWKVTQEGLRRPVRRSWRGVSQVAKAQPLQP